MALASQVGRVPVVFPCRQGKVVTFEAHGRWQGGAGRTGIAERTLTWHTRFLACSERAGRSVAIVRGLPQDLDWYQIEHRPRTYAIIQTASGLFIQPVGPAGVRDPASIAPLRDAQVLRFPVARHTCAVESGTRTDGRYCWFVDSIRPVARGPAWNISFDTLPDSTHMTIVPGLGITAYRYQHHGTVAEVVVKRIGAAE